MTKDFRRDGFYRHLLIALLLAAAHGCSSIKASEQLIWTVHCSNGIQGLRFQTTEAPEWVDGLWTFKPEPLVNPNEILPDEIKTNAVCIVAEGFAP